MIEMLLPSAVYVAVIGIAAWFMPDDGSCGPTRGAPDSPLLAERERRSAGKESMGKSMGIHSETVIGKSKVLEMEQSGPPKHVNPANFEAHVWYEGEAWDLSLAALDPHIRVEYVDLKIDCRDKGGKAIFAVPVRDLMGLHGLIERYLKQRYGIEGDLR